MQLLCVLSKLRKLKNLLILVSLISSATALTKEVEIIGLDCRGEVRYGRFFSDPVHVAFYPETFFKRSHRAFMKLKLSFHDNRIAVERSLNCDALVQKWRQSNLKKVLRFKSCKRN